MAVCEGLNLEGLSISAGEKCLVEDVSLSLAKSDLTCLIGPSGCGKSSVIKWLAGVLPTELKATAKLHLDGNAAKAPHPDIAYQPQQDTLFPWLTIQENAGLGLAIKGISRSERNRRLKPLFASFGLAGLEDSFPDQLSGGMRQRAAFLRASVQYSRFLLLDEPFSALDAVTRLHMQGWLSDRLSEDKRAVLMVTHDLYEATQLADRILVMSANPGRIIADFPITPPRAARNEASMAATRAKLKSLLMENT